jgi:hypothetical protein
MIISLFSNSIHGMEKDDKCQLAKVLKLCSSHSAYLLPTLFGSFDEPEARRKLCYVCNIDNIRNDAGNKIQDAYYKYMKQLCEQGHITMIDLLGAEKEVLEYKLKSSELTNK